MFFASAVLIAVISAGASYIQAKKAQKKAKEMTEGVESNIESNSKEIPVVYGERRVGGVRVYIDTSRDTKHKYLYMVLAMAEGEVESITDIKIDDIPITDARFITSGNKQNLWYETYTGTDTQNVSTLIKDGVKYNTTEDVWNDPWNSQHDRDSQLPDVTYPWGDNHRLQGVAYLALKFKWDENAYTGIPDVTAVVKGRKVYDPRTQTTAWSDNPALCIRDYLTNARYGKGLPASAIDDVAFGQAATDCEDFTVTPFNGSTATHQLFTMNHVVDTSKKILENLNDMLLSCRAFLPYSKGVYSLKIDQPTSSVLSIGADQIISGIAIAGNKKEDRFNQVKVNFFNKGLEFKEDQAIYPETNSTLYQTYLAEDDNEPLIEEVDIFSLNNFYSAREMARLILERSRQNSTIAFQGTSELINLEIGEVVSITHPTPSWTNKLFQVQEVSLNFDGTVNVTCIEYDAALYTYDTPDEEQPFIGSRLPDPNQVDPITSLSVSTGSYIENDGKTIGYIDASWSAPEDELVDRYEIKFEYNSREDVIEVATSQYRFKPTQDNTNYTVSVRAVNGLGIRSDWVTHTEVTSVIDTTAPSLPNSITATGGIKHITLDWTNPTEDDFDTVEIYAHTTDIADLTTVADTATLIATVRVDNFQHDIGANDATRHYFLRSVDRTGNKSAFTDGVSGTTVKVAGGDISVTNLGDISTDLGTPSAGTIDGNTLTVQNLSASSINTGTLDANSVTISNLTLGYSDITDTPTIPTAVSDLTNDTGFITSVSWNEVTSKPTDIVYDDDITDVVRDGDISGLALLLNKQADGTANVGEAALVGRKADGTVALNTDGYIVYNGDKITIPRGTEQLPTITILTGLSNKKGFIVLDSTLSNKFEFSSSYGNQNVVFAFKDGSGWKYDNNGSAVSFTPTDTDLALGYLETSTSDLILNGGLFGEPLPLTMASEQGATQNPQWFKLTGRTNTDAPSNADFNTAFSRNPVKGDVLLVEDTNGATKNYQYDGSAWSNITALIRGDMLVSGTVTANEINTNTVLTESLLANNAEITGDLTVTSGKITVEDTDTVINLDPDAQYPFRISQGTEDVVRLGSSTLDPFIKGAFIRGMPVQSINEADLTTFVRNVVGVTSEEKTETETLTRLPTGGNLVYLEADNITTGLTTVLTLESVSGTQSWLYEYEDESDWDSGESAFFNYTLQGYNGSAWEDITGWVNRPVFASGYRVNGAIIGWSISETYSRTIENNTYTHFRMVVGNMSGEFGGGLHPTSTGINCDFKLTAVTGSQVNSDNYADSFSINNTTGVMTIGRTGSLSNLTADISTYVDNQVSALVDSAPTTLDTLNELANALGDDPNFATTVTNSIATKASKSGDTFTGDVVINKESPVLKLSDNNSNTGSYPAIVMTTTNNQGVSLYHTEFDSELPFAGYGLVLDASSDNTQYPTTGDLGFVVKGEIYAGDTTLADTHKVWHAGDFSNNSSNWDTAYGWGNHASAGYLTSFDITTQTDPKYLRSNANDTYTGQLTFGNTSSRIDGSDTFPLVQVNSGRAYFGSTGRDKTVIASADKIYHVRAGTEYEIFTAHNFTDNSTNWNTAYGWGNHASAGYLTSLPSHNHDDRYYTESESDGRFVRQASLGLIGNSDVSFGSTESWVDNPVAGFYKTDYVGYSGLVFMSGDVGGSTSSIGLEFAYNGQFYMHSNTDSNRWDSHKVFTDGQEIVTTKNIKIDDNAWYWTRYSATDDWIRFNANNGGGLDVYNQTQSGFANIRAGSYNIGTTTVIDSNRNFTNVNAIKSDSSISFLTSSGAAQKAQFGGIGIGSSYATYPAFTGGVNTQNGYQVAGTTVIDSDRNATFAGLTTSSTITSGGNITIQNGSPVLILKDTNSTGTAQSGFISLKDSGNNEKGWMGYGSSGNTDLTVKNSLGRVRAYGSYFYADGYIDTPYIKVGDTTVIDSSRNLTNINQINLSNDHYLNRSFSMIENASPQYILLCANAGNNDVNGTITIDRTSGNYQAVMLDVIVSSGTSTMFGGTIRTLQVLQQSEDYRLVSVTYGGVNYIAVKYTGNTYPRTTARFNGRLKSTTGNQLTTVSSGISNEASFGGNSESYLEVDNFRVSGDIVSNEVSAGVIGQAQAGLLFQPNVAYRCIHPTTLDGSAHNSTISLGWSNNKFKDLYLAGAVKADGGYQVGSTAVIDSDQNLTNIADASIGTDSARFKRYVSANLSVPDLQFYAGGKTGWGVGDELGKIRWYINDGSGVGARDAVRIVPVCETGNGSNTTTFSGALAFHTSSYNAQPRETVRLGSGGNIDLKVGGYQINGTTVIDSSRNLTNIGDITANGLIISDTNGMYIGYHDTGNHQGNWSQFVVNNHADTVFGTNLYLNGNHDLVTSVTHSSIRGSAMVATGNNHSIGAGALAFYAEGDGSATQGTIVAEESWKLAVKSDAVDSKVSYKVDGTTVIDSNRNATFVDATLTGGDLRIYNDASNYGRILFGESPTDGNVIIEYDGTGSGSTNYLNFYSDVSGWMTKGSSLNIQPSTGNVAVGSNTYTEKFNVTGNIRSSGTIRSHYSSTNFSQLESNSVGGVLKLGGGGEVLLRSYGLSEFSGGIGIGSTTVIDSSRNIYGETITGYKVKTDRYSITAPRYDCSFYVLQSQHWYGHDGSQVMYLGESSNKVRLRGTLRVGSNADVESGYKFQVSGSAKIGGNILATSNVTAYSDERLKSDIKTLDGSKVYQMRGVSFTKDGEKGSGVIAQELEKVAPELVMTNDDEMQTKSVAYGNVVGYLIETCKEQNKRIEQLEKLVQQLLEK